MRVTPLLILAALCACAQAGASERQSLPPRPYDIVAVEAPQALADADFESFRKALLAAAKGRIYAELAQFVTPQGFFWDRDFANAYERRRPGVDNLASAIRLEHEDGAGWERLARFAAETAVEPQEARPGTVCAPARPRYDVVAYARLLDRTYTSAGDWAYPRAAKLPVHAAPSRDAPPVAELGLHFVRLLRPGGSQSAKGQDQGGDKERSHWTEIVTPSGKPGFVAPESLGTLTGPQLCYAKDALGRWEIAGFVAGG